MPPEEGSRDVLEDASSVKQCPSCAETIKAEAQVCRYCGHRFDRQPSTSGTDKSGAVMVGIAGLLAIIGSFLPWVTATAVFASVSRSGIEGGDGIISLILGVVILIIGIGRLGNFSLPGFMQSSAIVAGGALGILAFINYTSVNDRISEFQASAGGFGVGRVGAGIWTLFVASGLAVIGGIVMRTQSSRN